MIFQLSSFSHQRNDDENELLKILSNPQNSIPIINLEFVFFFNI